MLGLLLASFTNAAASSLCADVSTRDGAITCYLGTFLNVCLTKARYCQAPSPALALIHLPASRYHPPLR